MPVPGRLVADWTGPPAVIATSGNADLDIHPCALFVANWVGHGPSLGDGRDFYFIYFFVGVHLWIEGLLRLPVVDRKTALVATKHLFTCTSSFSPKITPDLCSASISSFLRPSPRLNGRLRTPRVSGTFFPLLPFSSVFLSLSFPHLIRFANRDFSVVLYI